MEVQCQVNVLSFSGLIVSQVGSAGGSVGMMGAVAQTVCCQLHVLPLVLTCGIAALWPH